MRPLRTICLWTVLAFLFSLCSPAVQAAWQCEGRTCGTTLWFCCCSSPEPDGDPNCDGRLPGQDASAGAACAAQCECVLTVRALDGDRRTAGVLSVTPDLHPVLLLPAPAALLVLPTEKVARTIESRGPPLAHRGLPSAGLRGPPFLTLPAIGC